MHKTLTKAFRQYKLFSQPHIQAWHIKYGATLTRGTMTAFRTKSGPNEVHLEFKTACQSQLSGKVSSFL